MKARNLVGLSAVIAGVALASSVVAQQPLAAGSTVDVLIGIGGRTGNPVANIYEIDPTTGTATVVGAFVAATATDILASPWCKDGVVYTTASDWDNNDGYLYSFDRASGVAKMERLIRDDRVHFSDAVSTGKSTAAFLVEASDEELYKLPSNPNKPVRYVMDLDVLGEDNNISGGTLLSRRRNNKGRVKKLLVISGEVEDDFPPAVFLLTPKKGTTKWRRFLVPSQEMLVDGHWTQESRIKTAISYPGKKHMAIGMINNNGGNPVESSVLTWINTKTGAVGPVISVLPFDMHGITYCE